MSLMAGLLTGLGDAGKAYVSERDSQSKEKFLENLETQKQADEDKFKQQDYQLRLDEQTKKIDPSQTTSVTNPDGTRTIINRNAYGTELNRVAATADQTHQMDLSSKMGDANYQKTLADTDEIKARTPLLAAQTANTQAEAEGKGIANALTDKYGDKDKRADIAEKVSRANYMDNGGGAGARNKPFDNSDQAADALFEDKGLKPAIAQYVALAPGQDGIPAARAREIAKASYEYAQQNGKNARDVFLNNLQLEAKNGKIQDGSAPAPILPQSAPTN